MEFIRRKRYQYEVTFALYMLTPTEKLIFDSIVTMLLTLLLVGIYVYLPEHVKRVTSRAIYYYAGDDKN